MQSKLYVKYSLFLVSAVLVSMGVVVAYFIFAKIDSEKKDLTPSKFFSRLIQSGTGSYEDRIASIEDIADSELPFRFVVFDATGKITYPRNGTAPLPMGKIKLPKHKHEAISVSEFLPKAEVVMLSQDPAKYLYIETISQKRGRQTRAKFLMYFGFLTAAILFGMSLSLLLIFRSLRKKAILADEVISQLKNGNLKARFPVSKSDELGHAMSRFNLMADEIERVVEKLRRIESSRTKLLQDLTHDLKTPVASLRNFLETLHFKDARIGPDLRKELLSFSLAETSYIERLVEDLLVLARASEPFQDSEKSKVDVTTILAEECDLVANHFPMIQASFGAGMQRNLHVLGEKSLLKRMVRNGLENAFSFARTQVGISIRISSDGKIEIIIQDDGPGISEEKAQNFGQRRFDRATHSQIPERFSIGLGAVIMRTVAQFHGGGIVIENAAHANATRTGTILRFILPFHAELNTEPFLEKFRQSNRCSLPAPMPH